MVASMAAELRLVRSYGAQAAEVIGNPTAEKDLGEHFGHGLYEAEFL